MPIKGKMRKLVALISVSLVLALLVIPADTEVVRADPGTLTIQPSNKDTFVYAADPDTNYGLFTRLQVMDRHTGLIDYRMRALLEFDISEIGPGVEITSATLQLYYYNYSNTDPVGKTIWAYKLTRTDWVESGTNGATWNQYIKSVSNWTTPGGDYVTSNPSGGSTTVPSSYGWMSWDVLDIVQDAYENSQPAEFLIRFETEMLASGYSTAWFYSRDYTTDPTKQPKLVVTYNTAPTNDSLEFINPYTGNQAIADDSTEWIFRAKVTDADGPDDIDYVLLRLANSSDNIPPYEALMFKWTQSTDTFEKIADTQYCATLTSTSGDSSSLGNQWTLDFKIKFNSYFDAQSTNYNAQLYTVDDASASDEDTYVDFYQVVPLSISIQAPDDILVWNLTPVGEQPLTQPGTLTVTSNTSWTVTVKDANATTNGHMTKWDGSNYDDAVRLYTAMKVAAQIYEVTLPTEATIATGTGDANVSVTFKQTVLWTDAVVTDPYCYRIVVTFIGSTE